MVDQMAGLVGGQVVEHSCNISIYAGRMIVDDTR
jgi:hypothetical protein